MPDLDGEFDAATLTRVSTLRSLDDFRRLQTTAAAARHIVVVGGGLLGSELAASLRAARGDALRVTLVMSEHDVFGKYLPPALAARATAELRRCGVEVETDASVRLVDCAATSGAPAQVYMLKVQADGGLVESTLDADHVVVAIGSKPATQVAELGGLELDENNGGIVVNSEMYARSGIYAAGDVASFYDGVLKQRRRVEHHDQAVASGRIAGLNMAGRAQSFAHQAVYGLGVGALQLKAVGRIDASLDTVSVWDEAKQATWKPAK